jgi:hypothetical protein
MTEPVGHFATLVRLSGKQREILTGFAARGCECSLLRSATADDEYVVA